ncbi:biotin/lipoyl-containing protein [Sphaerisporangium sp. NPDC005289]|uniref:acetyl-CoA carboxylase biotin carboxyl carrier protein n=1 Tax=Sphaerisporangium sp. NPDC005289 TaxID=3155247 RepID=UPI0033A5D734
MTAEPTPQDEGERVLDWVVRHAARLAGAGSAPLRSITVSTATLAVAVEWAAARGAGEHVPVPGAPDARQGGTGGHALHGGGSPDGAERGERPGEGLGDPAAVDGAVVVTSPMVGTFYRAHEPGGPPFVEVGDIVEPGQQVGIVEAMKLMNAVQAERGGRVRAIVAADGAPVQYEEPLLSLVPHEGP